jgi:alginate O-acetyltransferase complex protein AlgI
MIPQFKRAKHFVFSHKSFALGLTVFALGLFKKVVIADSLIPWVKPVFEQAGNVGFFEAWSGALAYTFQLYFDFSGYSEMAIGLGLLLNLRLPLNFDSPYKSFSIIEFWRRWHMTLSTFLKRYLYIPLGGNRQGQGKKMRNLMITMLLGGLWHGAGWTYVIWGGLHGLYLVINHTWRKFGVKLPKCLAWVVTFLAVVFAWVFFRAATVQDALALVQTMLGFKGIDFAGLQQLVGGKTEVLALMGLLLFVAKCPNVGEFVSRFRPNWQWAVLVSLVLVVSLLQLTHVTEFLYFQF